ncbi:MAG: HD domain-containing protein [Muricomes sp.]
MELKSIINNENIIGLVQRTLNGVDPRLIEHGVRVAFIVSCMLDIEGGYSKRDKQDIYILSVLHDIGAYKTEEINRMVEFEVGDIWEHSIYGYLFLKHLSPLKEWAKIILFHHVAANELPEMDAKIRRGTQILNLADRLETLSHGFDKEETIEKIREKTFKTLDKLRDTRFQGEVIDILKKAEERFSLLEELQKNKTGFIDKSSEIVLTEEECLQYLKILVYIIDFRSQYTVTHTIKTTSISCCLARYMDISEDRIERVYYGAQLHDLGKIGIPVEILESPGRLSKEEMDIMQTHVDITERILGNAVASDIMNISLRHHEKVDGSGYPRGLTGGQMTLEEQIVAVADIVSALLGKRSYKAAYPKDKTLAIVQNMVDAGKLNADIVNSLRENFDKMIVEVEESCVPALDNYYGIQREYLRLLVKYQSPK